MGEVIFFELLKPNKTIAETYSCEQLNRLRVSLKEKMLYLIKKRDFILSRDIEKPLAAKITKKKLGRCVDNFYHIHHTQ